MAQSVRTSAYAALTSLPPDLSQTEVLTSLLQELARATDAVQCHLWLPVERGFARRLNWPAQPPEGVTSVSHQATDLSSLAQSAGVDALARVADDVAVSGAITMTTSATGEQSADDRQWLEDTANCVLSVLRLGELRDALSAQTRHTDRLAGELAASHGRLAVVRDLERRRVAREIISLSTERLVRLHQQIDTLGNQLTPGAQVAQAAAPLRSHLDELIEDFRVMVRGIHPITLQTRGPRAALTEGAAGLKRRVRITGDVPARVDHEIATAVYYLTMTTLQTLAGTEREGALEVLLSHADGRLGVLVTGRSGLPASVLRAALLVDTDRLIALDGGVQVTEDGAEVFVRAWLPDRLEPLWQPQPDRPRSLSDRIRALTIALAARFGDGAGSAGVQVLLARLDGPLRLGIQGLSQYVGALTRLDRRFPDLVMVPYELNADGEMPDAVLRASHGTRPDRPDRVDVILPGAGALVLMANWDDLPHLLATEVMARADLLRARSVLAALSTLLRLLPVTRDGDDFEYRLDQLVAGAHELGELTALTQLRTSRRGLTRAQFRAAERLLGAGGAAPHERLALDATTTEAQLHRAAGEAISLWRQREQSAGGASRAVFGVIVRACEMILDHPDPQVISDAPVRSE